MLKVKKVGPDRVDLELSGKLDTESMKIALDELIEKTEGIENGRMLYDVVDIHVPSLGAMAVELSRIPSLFGLVRKIKRTAVLTDKAWIQKISEFEGKLLPGAEIKGFDRDQREDAENWLSSGN